MYAFVLIVLLFGVFIFCAKRRENSIMWSEEYEEYANKTISFFDNYLSLCKNHSVAGSCLCQINAQQRYVEMFCKVSSIDDKTAEYQYFTHCEDLHYFLTKIDKDKYKFDKFEELRIYIKQQIKNPVQVNKSVYDKLLKKTFEFVKAELEKKWKTVDIFIGKRNIYITTKNSEKYIKRLYNKEGKLLWNSEGRMINYE